jgi:hypothetical protein
MSRDSISLSTALSYSVAVYIYPLDRLCCFCFSPVHVWYLILSCTHCETSHQLLQEFGHGSSSGLGVCLVARQLIALEKILLGSTV